MKKIPYAILFIFLLVPQLLQGQTDENLIKAGLIEKFALFTQWPQPMSSDNIIISVIGTSPFNKSLDEYYKSQKINNTSVKVRFISSINEIENSHILFISQSEAYRLKKILEYTKDKPILTISENDDFAKKGVLINFYKTPENTLHFEMNTYSIKESGLKIDAMLLNYALIVN